VASNSVCVRSNIVWNRWKSTLKTKPRNKNVKKGQNCKCCVFFIISGNIRISRTQFVCLRLIEQGWQMLVLSGIFRLLLTQEIFPIMFTLKRPTYSNHFTILGRVRLGSIRKTNNWNNASKRLFGSYSHSGIPGFLFLLFCSQEQNSWNKFQNIFLFRNIPNERALNVSTRRKNYKP